MSTLFSSPPGLPAIKLWLFSIIGLVLAAFVSPWIGMKSNAPDETTLLSATGSVISITQHKYGIKFQLTGHSLLFDYPSKHRATSTVLAALTSAGSQQVTIKYSTPPREPMSTTEKLHDVWEIKVGETLVRSLAEAKAGWTSDEAFRPWLAGAFALCGVYLAILGWRARSRTPRLQ
jgi:hypothetical protein